MIFGAYCVGKVHNMLPQYYLIIGAYCVGKIHYMLPQKYYDIRSILCS